MDQRSGIRFVSVPVCTETVQVDDCVMKIQGLHPMELLYICSYSHAISNRLFFPAG
jgi:hypothetical protein